MVFLAQITGDGGLSLGSDLNRARFKEFCKEHVGAWLRIEHQVPVRSMSQHRFYWVYLGAIAHETGHTPEEIHAWVKAKFLPKRFATVLGTDVELTPTTTTLSKVEFGEVLDRVCAETGVPLPDPQAAGYPSH
jgi:hypothetical protein